jgi:hypothetical protein
MKQSRWVRIAFLFAAAVTAAGLTVGPARADDEFDLSVKNGQVTVTAHEGWHINQEFPWKLTIGDTKLDKTKFTLKEKTASVDAPKGAGKLKGAVCSKDQCHVLEKAVTVP